MRILEVKQSELKQITLFLIEKKILLHPLLSPDGVPDFTGYENKKFEIILDRNLFVYLVNFLKKGELKDHHQCKLISSLMFWIEFNGFSLTSGLALAEYANFKNSNYEANQDYNIFNKLFSSYSPKHWLDLAIGRSGTIPKTALAINSENDFQVESAHFKMHYIEMLKLAQLFYSEEISITNKFHDFFSWIYENIIICRYTTCLSAKILSGKSKIFKLTSTIFQDLNKACINQAWDLTYLSIWSTFYWYEQEADKIYLMATADKELKEIFILTNKFPEEIFSSYFGKQKGQQIKEIMNKIYLPRSKREIKEMTLNKMIEIEKSNLEKQINYKYGLL